MRRTDWLMRHFVEDIALCMTVGMPASQAQQLMTERGVPLRVQWRICDR